LDPTIAAQWAPKGCQPLLPSDSTRERVNLCGIVDINTMDAIVQRIPRGNAEIFISTMDLIKESYHNYSRITLYVDNAKWHKAKLVREYLAKQVTIELMFFPPYSPELNPTEWEWHELRRQATHARRFHSSDECWQTIQTHFETRKGKNKHLLCQLI
jgi:transposase